MNPQMSNEVLQWNTVNYETVKISKTADAQSPQSLQVQDTVTHIKTELNSLQQQQQQQQRNTNPVPKKQYHEANEALREENGKLMSENLIFQHDRAELNKELQLQKEINDKMKRKCASLTQQTKQLLENIQELNNQQEKQKYANTNPEIIRLNSQVNSLSGKLNLLRDENKSLEKKIGELESEQETVQKVKVEANSQNQEEIFELKFKIKLSEENVNSLIDENVNLSNQIVNLKGEVDTIHKQNEKLKADCRIYSGKLKRARAENEYIEQLRGENKKLELELSSESNEKAQLKLKLDGESERVRQANVLASDQNNLIKRLTAELAEQKVQMLKEKEEKGATISRRQLERTERLEKQLKNLEQDKEELQRKLDKAKKIEDEQNRHNEKVVQLTKKIHDLEKYNHMYESENVQNQQIIERMFDEKAELNWKFQSQLERAEALECLLQNEKLKIKEATNEISTLKFQTSFLEKSVKEYKEVIFEQKMKLENNDKHVAELRMRLSKLQSENEWLETSNNTGRPEFRGDSPITKARKRSHQHVHTQDDDDHDFLWKMVCDRKK